MTPEQQRDIDRRELRRARVFACVALIMFGRAWRRARGNVERERVLSAIDEANAGQSFRGIDRGVAPPLSYEPVELTIAELERIRNAALAWRGPLPLPIRPRCTRAQREHLVRTGLMSSEQIDTVFDVID